ncbi:hypothetical protein EVAR_13591_1 [Eumeta japonica]|uniref:Uncharacterized protein n=1 Tax=Eumeta variegata TaxID=151549 RepID=A0A4C1U9N0_EUMVA|nr:hypothetical protein EVAR_13591_1 [Eumeta japonica]
MSLRTEVEARRGPKRENPIQIVRASPNSGEPSPVTGGDTMRKEELSISASELYHKTVAEAKAGPENSKNSPIAGHTFIVSFRCANQTIDQVVKILKEVADTKNMEIGVGRRIPTDIDRCVLRFAPWSALKETESSSHTQQKDGRKESNTWLFECGTNSRT